MLALRRGGLETPLHEHPIFPFTPSSVILFPAIDLKDGKCVRLVQGDMTRATIGVP